MNMTIHCQDLMELTRVCAQLVREGVTFKAITNTMTITLMGGY